MNMRGLFETGEVRERPNRAVSKTAVGVTRPWVRIPPSPPYQQPCLLYLPNRSKTYRPKNNRERVGFEQEGPRGKGSPVWGAYEGAGPLSRSVSNPANATSNTHPRHSLLRMADPP